MEWWNVLFDHFYCLLFHFVNYGFSELLFNPFFDYLLFELKELFIKFLFKGLKLFCDQGFYSENSESINFWVLWHFDNFLRDVAFQNINVFIPKVINRNSFAILKNFRLLSGPFLMSIIFAYIEPFIMHRLLGLLSVFST